jgi:hypothetical protein
MKYSEIHGNSDGIETTLNFVESAIPVLADNGKMLIIISSLSNDTKIDEFLVQMKLKRRTISKKKLFFERLTTLEISFQ